MGERVNSAVSVQPDRLKDLLKELLDIYSPTGKEEEILRHVHSHLQRHGVSVIEQPVDENRYNLLVLPDNPDEITLCFVGHLDTVPAYDIEDYEFYEEQGEIFGLGAVDMKSGCAAMIEAFTVLVERGADLSRLGLALVVGEEEESDGARALVREYRFPWAVIGEPTGLSPCLGHYGYLEVLLRTRGKRAHASLPELGQNAVEAMLQLLLQISQFVGLESSELVYSIRELSSSSGGFVVPDVCEAWLDFHLLPEARLDTLKCKLEMLVESARESITNLDATLRFEETHSGYYVSEERLFVRKLKKLYQQLSMTWQPQNFRSHSDGSLLWAAGVDPIILGPGRLELAHTSEEMVEMSQVIQAAELYTAIAEIVA